MGDSFEEMKIVLEAYLYEMIDAVDPDWQGAIPYTLLVEPGGKIIYGKQDVINSHESKRLIVENKYLGRY